MLYQQPYRRGGGGPSGGAGGGGPSERPGRADLVLRRFVVDGRLVAVPAQRGKRLVVLDYLAGLFEPGVRYREAEVNQALRAYHPDYAALRRYLVDEGFMKRERGVYWRSGGTVDVGDGRGGGPGEAGPA
jgi:hypothetical protein